MTQPNQQQNRDGAEFNPVFWAELRAALDGGDVEAFASMAIAIIMAFYPRYTSQDEQRYRTDLEHSMGPRGRYRRHLSEVLEEWRTGSFTKLHFFGGTNGERLCLDGEEKTLFYAGNSDDPLYLEAFRQVFGTTNIQL